MFAELLPLVLLALVFYLLIMRPMRAQKQRFAEMKRMQDGLQPGTSVMLTSGIHGTVQHVYDSTIGLEIAPNIVVTVERAAVAEIKDQTA